MMLASHHQTPTLLWPGFGHQPIPLHCYHHPLGRKAQRPKGPPRTRWVQCTPQTNLSGDDLILRPGFSRYVVLGLTPFLPSFTASLRRLHNWFYTLVSDFFRVRRPFERTLIIGYAITVVRHVPMYFPPSRPTSIVERPESLWATNLLAKGTSQSLSPIGTTFASTPTTPVSLTCGSWGVSKLRYHKTVKLRGYQLVRKASPG